MGERVYPGWGIALVRVVLGIVFLVHGWEKLFGDAGVTGFAAMLGMEGFPAAGVLAWGVTLVELLGGLLLLMGWLTRWVAAVLFLEMLVALFAVHVEYGFFVFRPAGEWGYEYNLVLLAGLGCLVLAGGGKLAMDDWIVRRVGGV
jgi:putative oxidoreductase